MCRSYFGRIRRLGYLMVGYSLLKALGPLAALVLERLHTEYQHAIRNELLYKGKFSVSIPHLAFYIGFTISDVVDAINDLIALDLIGVEKLKDDLYSVKIYEEEIYNFEKTKEAEKHYKMYDYQLYTMQSYGYTLMETSNGEIPFEVMEEEREKRNENHEICKRYY